MALSGEHQRALLHGVNLRAAITIVPELFGRILPEQLQQYQDTLNQSYATARRKGQIPLLSPGFGLATVGGLSAADIQLIELLKYSVEDIGRAFGVPPRMLGHFHEGAKVATTFEGHAVDFERWSVQEHVQRVQAQLTTKLVSADDAAQGLVVRMPADRIRAGSWTEQVRAVDQAVAKAGVMTINEKGGASCGCRPCRTATGCCNRRARRRRRRSGMMTPREFRDTRLALGLSTEQLAERLGVDPRTIRRWQDGRQSVPGPVTMAMALLLRQVCSPAPRRSPGDTG